MSIYTHHVHTKRAKFLLQKKKFGESRKEMEGRKRDLSEEEEEEESYEASIAGMGRLIEDVEECVKRAKLHHKRLGKEDDEGDNGIPMEGVLFHQALADLSSCLKRFAKDTGD
jgi:hypothetical protein